MTILEGSVAALRYAARDLETLKVAVGLCSGRTAVVQAGGNLGVFARHLADEFATVYTFEPDAANFSALCKNVPNSNVVKLQAALGSESTGLVSTVRERRVGPKPFHDGLTHVTHDNGTIPTFTIDQLMLPVCELLVLDLEGFELFALTGARQTIRRCRPVLMVEVGSHSNHYGVTEGDVRTLIRMSNYRMHARVHSDEVYVPC